MKDKRLFRRFYGRLAIEGVFKAFILALILASLASIIPAISAIYTNSSPFFYAAIVAIVTVVLATPVFYFVFFRPRVDLIAHRVDRLGLEERLITMMELEKDNSYIAMCQREDAKAKLKETSRKGIKLSLFRIPVVILSFVFLITMSIVTVSALNEEGVVPWSPVDNTGWDKTGYYDPLTERPIDEEHEYILVYYMSMGGGYIEGDDYQVVIVGEDCTPILAVPYDGYAFAYWLNDGSKAPARHDKEICEENYPESFYESEITLFARFEPIGEGKDPNDKGDGKEPQEIPTPAPGDDGEFDPNNIIDGTIYYGEDIIFGEYFTLAMQYIMRGEAVPADVLEIIQIYFGGLRKS